MRLPNNILNKDIFSKPDIFLCESDKTKICKLDTINTVGNFKFNSYSELSFDVYRTFIDLTTGEILINPYYDKIEALRLIFVENFGYFEIQGPTLNRDGIQEYKSVTCYSFEYTLSQKYLDDFNINTGKVDSLEVLNATDPKNIVPITLYNQSNGKLSLLNLLLEKTYGWQIGHVDESLKTMSRQFEIDRMSVYDFLMNEVCEKFNCYISFEVTKDKNLINVYAESLTSKFIGDGKTNKFTINPPFKKVKTVTIDGYKTTEWSYDSSNGIITLTRIPESGQMIEVIDGADEIWETDAFITFDNLSKNVEINYDADSIKTVLTVTYGDNYDIREANLGLPYITDLSYYYTIDWMGEGLYNSYTKYLQKINDNQLNYTNNSKKMQEIAGYIDFEQNRLALDYSVANVTADTVGKYYVRGGNPPDYFYTEVSLPAEYNVNTTYYTPNAENLNEEKVNDLYMALRDYFKNGSLDKLNALNTVFSFMEVNTIPILVNNLQSAQSDEEKEGYVKDFLDEMWNQVGQTPLEKLYYDPYKKVQVTNLDAGWSQKESENYPFYYTVVILLETIETAINKRKEKIDKYKVEYKQYQDKNAEISKQISMENNFTKEELIKLSAFLREDELQLDEIVETNLTTLSESYQLKQDAMESAKIELNKLSRPKLQFSMDMANIYALKEFEPIISQFQLGNIIKVGIREDYIKNARLLEVQINFDDFSDFSCEFGELTNFRTQSDIHADLLKNAVQAGKSVATFSDYWSKGADKATNTDLKIQSGLLDAITSIKSMDGTQDVEVDKYGIHLRRKDPETGEFDPKQGWITNNKFLYSSDGFKTTNSVFGEYTVPMEGYPDGVQMWGLLAQAVIAGYVEGSQIVGGTIKIGLQSDGSYAFEVRSDGSVVMNGGSTIDGQPPLNQGDLDGINGEIDGIKGEINDINNKKMYEVSISSNGSEIISKPEDKVTLTCIVSSWDSDVTDTIDAKFFKWKRISSNPDYDIQWNGMPEHMGVKQITIDADDVIENASFYCEVELP